MTEANLLTITIGDREIIDVALTGITNAQMAGAAVKFMVRWRPDSAATVIEKTQLVGIAVDVSGVNPALAITIDPVDTAWLPKQRHGLFYDVEVSPVGGSGPLTVAQGRLLAIPDVSR